MTSSLSVSVSVTVTVWIWMRVWVSVCYTFLEGQLTAYDRDRSRPFTLESTRRGKIIYCKSNIKLMWLGESWFPQKWIAGDKSDEKKATQCLTQKDAGPSHGIYKWQTLCNLWPRKRTHNFVRDELGKRLETIAFCFFFFFFAREKGDILHCVVRQN